MSGRELVGELMYDVLVQALSGSEDERVRAEEKILGLETRSGFYASLAEVGSAGSEVGADVKWLAVVCIKNAVPRSWRKRNNSALTEDERVFVRKTLLGMVGVSDQMLATQVSVVIGRIARLNCPEEWSDLIPTLMTVISTTATDEQKRIADHALETLQIILKEFSTRRLSKDRKTYEAMASELLGCLLPIWEMNVADIVTGGSNWPRSLHTAKLVMKSIRQILAHALPSVDGNEFAQRYFRRILELPDIFLRGAQGGSDEEMALSKLAAKSVVEAQNRHPTGFREYLRPFLEVYTSLLMKYDPGRSSEKAEALGCVFVKNVAQCPTYRRPIGSSGEDTEVTPAAAAGRIVEDFFSTQTCVNLIQELIARIFVLTESELQSWADDPEGFIRDEEAADWNSDKLRPIAEALYVSLLSRHRDLLVGTVLGLTESVRESELLLRDACYRAIGRGCYEFTTTLNFAVWFQGQLEPQLKAPISEDMRGKVAKARATWLIGQFVSQIPRDMRVIIYGDLVPLLGDGGDLVIRLTTVGALNALVEDLDFDGSDYAPFFLDSITGIFQLSSATEETESLSLLLQFATNLIEKTEPEIIQPHLGSMAKELMILWDSGVTKLSRSDDLGSKNLIRSSIVSLLKKIIEVVGPTSVKDPDIVKLSYPVIYFGTLTEGGGGVYLTEDAMDLWLVLLHELEEYVEEMSNLFPNLVGILRQDFDNLKVALDIIVAYAVVGGAAFMRTHGQSVLDIFLAITGNVRDRGAVAASEAIEVLLQLFPLEASKLLVPVFSTMLDLLMAKKESTLVSKNHDNLIARVVVQDYDAFEMLIKTQQGHEANAAVARERMLFVVRDLIDKTDMHWGTLRKKLSGMALCAIMARNNADEELLLELPMMLNVLVQVLAELDEEKAPYQHPEAAPAGHLVTFIGLTDHDEQPVKEMYSPRKPTLYQQRLQSIHDNDFAANLNFADVCRTGLNEIRNRNPSGFDAVVATASPSILKQLQERI
eukprot:CAMPEP_0184745120 /NCGR_PEP_ID=MMETSP0315-20130426/7820_1 /TAXON_ID=101924 /ORGANISM="Rhodosorus marinus, Strain UTEX LB 2760" /LENGTH=992 /DNA_ID=CAMNT_0027217141 /DNA_START=113 /DNA_END=3091 /DNA_ORIENTATION=+